jgi:hypothetical protein
MLATIIEKEIIKDNFFYNLRYCYCEKQFDVFRIFISIFSIISILSYLIDFYVILDPNGLIPWEITNADSHWFELHPLRISKALQISEKCTIIIVISLYLISLLSLGFGICTRISAGVALLCLYIITNIVSLYSYGVDVYQNVCLFFLLLLPSGYYYSLTKKIHTSDYSKLLQIGVRTLQIYLILTYMSAGIEKSMMKTWWNGEFIYLVLNDPTVTPLKIISDKLPIYFYSFLGSSVVILEATYCIFCWIPYYRSILILSIIMMHLFIGFCMDLSLFGFLLIMLNIICWFPALISDYKKIKIWFTGIK